jgi:LacI family transcriptional regulator
VATIYDVAKRARVSTYTVSCVLNRSAYVSPELTARVQKAVKELDYTINEVARSLQTRKSRTVGMLIPDISNPFFSQVVRGAEQRLKKDG